MTKFADNTLYYLPVTLTNSASGATSANLQVKITVNSNTYNSYEASNLINLNWQDGAGNILNSWLESGLTNASTASVYWVNLGSLTIAGSNGTLVIYLCFYNTSTNNFSSGGTTGAQPNFDGTYGHYDNGSQVFDYYTDWPSTSLPSGWIVGTGTGSSVSNGLILTSTSATTEVYYNVAINSKTEILEAYESAIGSANAVYPLGLSTTGNSGNPYGASSVAWAMRLNAVNGTWAEFNWSSGASNAVADTITGAVNTYHVISLWENGTTNIQGLYDYANGTSNAVDYVAETVQYIFLQINANSSTVNVAWLRYRQAPPSYTAPTSAFGSITVVTVIHWVEPSHTHAIAAPTTGSGLLTLINGGLVTGVYMALGSLTTAPGFTSVATSVSVGSSIHTHTMNASGTACASGACISSNNTAAASSSTSVAATANYTNFVTGRNSDTTGTFWSGVNTTSGSPVTVIPVNTGNTTQTYVASVTYVLPIHTHSIAAATTGSILTSASGTGSATVVTGGCVFNTNGFFTTFTGTTGTTSTHTHTETGAGSACTLGTCVNAGNTGSPSATTAILGSSNSTNFVTTMTSATTTGGVNTGISTTPVTVVTAIPASTGNNTQTATLPVPIHTHTIGAAGTTTFIATATAVTSTALTSVGSLVTGTACVNGINNTVVAGNSHIHAQGATGSSCVVGTCVKNGVDVTGAPSNTVSVCFSVATTSSTPATSRNSDTTTSGLTNTSNTTKSCVTSIPSTTGANVTP